jgi:hypothetical protein
MKEAGQNLDVDYKRESLRLLGFVLGNAAVFLFFSLLWIWQYHINSSISDRIDAVVAPWGWLAGFFAATFFALRGVTSTVRLLFVSLGFSVLLSLVLFFVIHLVLAPHFDPMW